MISEIACAAGIDVSQLLRWRKDLCRIKEPKTEMATRLVPVIVSEPQGTRQSPEKPCRPGQIGLRTSPVLQYLRPTLFLSFDGAWIDWYLQKSTNCRLFYRPRDPGLSYGAGVDIPSLVMAKTGWGYQRCNRDNYPATWLGGHEHNHRELDDARGYAHLLTLALTGNIHQFASGL